MKIRKGKPGPVTSICDEMDCEYKDIVKEVKDLLAIIHYDGGHYTEEHGIEKSIIEAKSIVTNNKLCTSQLRETIVNLWHDAKSDNGALHECMSMTWDEYKKWVQGF